MKPAGGKAAFTEPPEDVAGASGAFGMLLDVSELDSFDVDHPGGGAQGGSADKLPDADFFNGAVAVAALPGGCVAARAGGAGGGSSGGGGGRP